MPATARRSCCGATTSCRRWGVAGAQAAAYAYHDHLQATNKFYLAAVVLSDPVLETVRRELRRLSGVKLEVEDLREALQKEVIKREVIEGEKADGARKKVAKAAGKTLRVRKEKEGEGVSEMIPATAAIEVSPVSLSDEAS